MTWPDAPARTTAAFSLFLSDGVRALVSIMMFICWSSFLVMFARLRSRSNPPSSRGRSDLNDLTSKAAPWRSTNSACPVGSLRTGGDSLPLASSRTPMMASLVPCSPRVIFDAGSVASSRNRSLGQRASRSRARVLGEDRARGPASPCSTRTGYRF